MLGSAKLAVLPSGGQFAQHVLVQVALHIQIGNVMLIQSMRWSKFKNNDPRDIFNVISQRVFPAIKNMKHGRLPDFTEQGLSLIHISFCASLHSCSLLRVGILLLLRVV